MNPVDHPHGGGEGKSNSRPSPRDPLGQADQRLPDPGQEQAEQQVHRSRPQARQAHGRPVRADGSQSQEGAVRRRPADEADRGHERRQREAHRQDLVAFVARSSRRWSGHTIAVHDGRKHVPVYITREHGGPQARRVRADAHLSGPRRLRPDLDDAPMSTDAARDPQGGRGQPRKYVRISARKAPARRGPRSAASRSPTPRRSSPSAPARPPCRSARCCSRPSPTPTTTTASTPRELRLVTGHGRRGPDDQAVPAARPGPRHPIKSARATSPSASSRDEDARHMGQKINPHGFRLGILERLAQQLVHRARLRQVPRRGPRRPRTTSRRKLSHAGLSSIHLEEGPDQAHRRHLHGPPGHRDRQERVRGRRAAPRAATGSRASRSR